MDKNKDFKRLVEKYLDARTTQEEEKRLLGYYEAMQKHKEWDEELMGNKEEVHQRVFLNIVAEVDEIERVSKVVTWKRWMIAASVVLLLGLGMLAIYFRGDQLSHTEGHDNIVNLSEEILPGGNRATLTLADGTQIILDDAVDGELAKQSNTIIRKTKDGQLVYDLSETMAKSVEISFNTITTPRGGQYQLILPDGTKVWLNSMSSLTFPSAFSGSIRQVELHGEAYFEVAKNGSKPFHVHAGDARVKVLGTAFNVMSYPEEQYVETTLAEGSVEVGMSSSANSMVIGPGQQARVGKDKIIYVLAADVEKIIAWKEGYFQFRRDNIQDIMKKFEKWYDIEVSYEGQISNEEFVGRIRRSVTLSQALQILKLSNINFKIEGRHVVVSN